MPIQVFPPSPGNFGSSTSPVGTEQSSTTTATASLVLSPPGFYMVQTGAHNTVRYSPDSGNTRRQLIGTGAGGVVWSDGQNVDIYNDATGGTVAHYAQILGPV